MNQIQHQLVIYVNGKANLMDPSSSTISTHVTTFLAGKVECHYQDSVTSIWKTSKITTDVIIYQFKVSTEPRPVPIRRYVSIVRDDLLSSIGTGT